jgi:phage gp36-like protein
MLLSLVRLDRSAQNIDGCFTQRFVTPLAWPTRRVPMYVCEVCVCVCVGVMGTDGKTLHPEARFK